MSSSKASYKSKPLLPAEYIKKVEANPLMKGFRSSVYDSRAHKTRFAMRNWQKPLSPDCIIVVDEPEHDFTAESKWTNLHLVASQGDVLAISEFLFLGADPRALSSTGLSPLFVTVAQLDQIRTVVLKWRKYNGGDGKKKMRERETYCLRLAWVARILIEQHSDVNLAVSGVSLLDLACRGQSWDTIRMLLKHGATHNERTLTFFDFAEDRARFKRLLESMGTIGERPPRVCPCWSGLTVSECHAKAKVPYPMDYMCICGSGKTHQKCCYQRTAMEIYGYWDKKNQRITQDYDRLSVFSTEIRECNTDLDIHELIQDPEVMAMRKNLVSSWVSNGMIDPAFEYALKRVDFTPLARRRTMSKKLCEGAQIRWNELIDEYIESGKDVKKRTKDEIERAAKIGPWNGALIRSCEGVGCDKVERKDIMTLKQCTRCKLAVYCSTECQKSAWPTHKNVCGNADQIEQELPSQVSLRREQDKAAKALVTLTRFKMRLQAAAAAESAARGS